MAGGEGVGDHEVQRQNRFLYLISKVTASPRKAAALVFYFTGNLKREERSV